MQDKRFKDKFDLQLQRVKDLTNFQFEKQSYNNPLTESFTLPVAIEPQAEEVKKVIYEDLDDTFSKLDNLFIQ